MSTIELSLHKDYVPNWSSYEGIREILQNARDGEVKHQAKMKVVYRANSKTLVIENEGISIPKEALLIGYSTKRNSVEEIGQYGEGLDLGLLALVREEMDVLIHNGDEIWKPIIERSERFTDDVLKIRTRKNPKPDNNFRVTIRPVSPEEWKTMKKLFLFIQAPPEDKTTRVPSGTIIKDSEYVGYVFVKGIFVQKVPGLDCGYDLPDCKLDRDRMMISTYDMKWKLAQCWKEAMLANKAVASHVFDMLEKGSDDVEDMNWLGEESAAPILEQFEQKYGKLATPVENIAQSKEVEHLGKQGVVVPRTLSKVLEKKLGTYEERKHKMIEQTASLISWQDLTLEEQENLSSTIDMMSKIAKSVTLNQVQVKEFYDEDINGMRQGNDISIARKVLSDKATTLAVLAHEFLHTLGEDGEVRFHHSVEQFLAEVAVSNSKEKKDHES